MTKEISWARDWGSFERFRRRYESAGTWQQKGRKWWFDCPSH